MNNRRKFKLSELSDDQILKFMEETVSDEEDDDAGSSDFSSDDEWNDSDYVPAEKSFDDDRCISICINDMNAGEKSDYFIQPNNFSLNFTDFENASVANATPSTSAASVANTAPSTSASGEISKTQKRIRSPLPSFEETDPSISASSGGFTLSSMGDICKDSHEFSRMTRRKRSMRLHENEIGFLGNSKMPDEIMSFNTPMEYFCYFYTPEIVQIIVEEANRAAIAEDINTKFKTSVEEIYQYIGVLIYMSVYRYPNIESYWGKNAFQAIQRTMPLKKFLAIKRYLRFEDETGRIKKGMPGYDPLFRIKSVAEKINQRFDSIPKTARLCVDEQMCSTKIRHHHRQYMPIKPHKWGIKLYISVDCPQIVKEYNAHMGGADLMDGLMGRYHIRLKTRNPMTKIFYHLLDMAATNAYIMYRRVEVEKKNDSRYNSETKLLKLPNFREEIAADLVTYSRERAAGRKSRSTTPQPDYKIGQKAKHPVADVRFDGYMHLPKWLPKDTGKKKCKLCKTSQTQCICEKCNLHLCCSASKNCFTQYHFQNQ